MLREARELLERSGGARIPEIADELEVTREQAREIVNKIDEEHELGSSADFSYQILTGPQAE